MSLQIWLPLMGDTYNQGLSNYTITSSNLTYESGKLGGSCAKFNNSYVLLKNTPLTTNTKEFSFAFWYKTTSPASTQCLYNGRVSVGSAIAIFVIGNKFRFDDGAQHTFDYTIPANTWNHYVFTRDKSSIKLYVNGVLQQSITSTDFTCNATYASIGMSSVNTASPSGNAMIGNLQDYRIYDHALSTKEVKELSKGLTIHLPLSWGGNPNKIKNSMTWMNKNVGYTNVTASEAGWIDDTNVPVGNGYMKFCVDNTSGTSTLGGRGKYWGWSTQLGSGTITDYMTSGATYTYSFYARGSNANLGRTPIAESQTLVSYTIDGVPTSSDFPLTNDWKKYTVTFKWTSTAKLTACFYLYNVLAGKKAEINLCGLKLEEGNKATPWIPNVNDTIYTSIGFDKIVSQDCSGYNRNATVTNCILDLTAPRYSNSTKFLSTSDKFVLKPSLSSGQTTTEFTTAIWAKTNTLNSTAPNIISLGQNSFWRFRLATGTSVWYYVRVGSTQVYSTYTTKNLIDNVWHHYALTFKDGVIRFYIDGVQVGTTDYSATAKYITCASTNWVLHSYDGSSEAFVGSLSDCRIYHTCLSADDVKELYQTPISIDKAGKLFCNNLVEE